MLRVEEGDMSDDHGLKAYVACRGVRRDSYDKLLALVEFSGMDLPDVAALALERGIEESWEGYRQNPKHADQIEQWEKEHEKVKNRI